MTKIEYFIDSYSSVLQSNINTQNEKRDIYKTARVQAIAITELNTSGWPNAETTTIGQLLAYIFPNEDALLFDSNLPDDIIGGTTINPVYLNVIAILNGNQSSPTTKELYNKLDKNCNAKLLIDNYNRAKDFGGQKWFDSFMSSALAEMKIQGLKMSDFTTPSIFDESYKDLLANFRRNNAVRATTRYASIEELYDAFIEAGENYNQPVVATQSGTQSGTQSVTQSSSKTGDYKIIVKDPKTDNGKKIEGSISFTELGPNVTANSVLNNLPNPWTDVRTNLPVPDNTGTITYESFPFSKSTDNYEKILADDSIKVLQSIIADKYGVEILLTYEPVSLAPTQSVPTTTATSSVVSATASEPREYTFDVQIKDTFYNSEIGYLTITGKVEDIFVYGDQQDTIDTEYTEDIFAGSEEDQLLLASIEQIYPAEVLAELPPEEVKIIKENAKAAQKLGKPLKSPPNDLLVAMRKYGITSKLERAHFLAQCAHESGNYVYKSELASGKAYEGRKDLGNTNPGDGPKYKGRGFIQVTGRANYEAYSKYLVSKGLDNILNNPDLVATKYSADAACYWWKFLSRNITNLALKGSSSSVVELVTRRVNGGTNGLPDRQQKFDKLWGEISQDESRYA
jgi:predicted chitinase